MTQPATKDQTDLQSPISTTLSDDDLRALGAGILRNLAKDARIHAESPPEAELGALLRLCTPTQPDPSIDVMARERVVLPTTPATVYEVDLLIRDVSGGASCVVEVDSWQWHRRSAAEHAEEIERDRQLRACYPHVLRYAASEVGRNPWRVLLDICEQMSTWTGFGSLQMNPVLRAVAQACTTTHRSSASGGDNDVETGAPLSLLNSLRAVAAELPTPPPTDDPALSRIREAYPRMYACWEASEIEAVRDAFVARVDIEDIAMILGRTERAIWAQVRRLGLIAA